MRRLSASDRESRLAFDFRIAQRMNSTRYQISAHRTAQDAISRKNPIKREADARHATHYRAEFAVRTLIGPGDYSDRTVVRVDISAPKYPFVEPTGWVVKGASKLPYSPHFAHGVPICNGTIWRRDGQITLGHYFIHIARLLNWDEPLVDGYGGYNPRAVKWWRTHINAPLNPSLVYPALPTNELYGDVVAASGGGFRSRASSVSHSGGFRSLASP